MSDPGGLLTRYHLDRLSVVSPEFADEYLIDFAPHKLKIQVLSVYIPGSDVEVSYDPRITSEHRSPVIIFNTYLSSQLYNILCCYFHASQQSTHEVGGAADELVRLNLKKIVADRMIAAHNAQLGYALMFEFLSTGEAKVREAFASLDASPSTRLIKKFFQCLADDFVLWHEIAHALYRMPDPAVAGLRAIAAEMAEVLRANGADPRLIDDEEIFCDLYSLGMCGVRFTHNMSLQQLTPILNVLVRMFAIAVTASGHAEVLLQHNEVITAEQITELARAREFIWPRAEVALNFLERQEFADFVTRYRSVAKLEEVPVAVAVPPLANDSMSWAVTNVMDCDSEAIRRACAIAAEAISRGPDAAKTYVLGVTTTRRHDNTSISSTSAHEAI